VNLIYQYWDGELRSGVEASRKNIAEYAARIGAEHRFEHNPRYFAKSLGAESKYYGAFRPIHDNEFDQYDNVLFLDSDIFAVEDLQENVFDAFSLESEIGMCTEPFQPKQRTITLGQITSARDEKWAKIIKQIWDADLPRTEEGLLQVYNSGVVLYSREARIKARERFVDFKEYIQKMKSSGMINFYALDQNYLHAMIFICDMKLQEMHNGWNSYIHYTRDRNNPNKRVNDCRTSETKLVHAQGAGLDRLDEEALYRVVNLPESEWKI
jgi:lipopolysaccharide biosynthesis glycosyltransferase